MFDKDYEVIYVSSIVQIQIVSVFIKIFSILLVRLDKISMSAQFEMSLKETETFSFKSHNLSFHLLSDLSPEVVCFRSDRKETHVWTGGWMSLNWSTFLRIPVSNTIYLDNCQNICHILGISVHLCDDFR